MYSQELNNTPYEVRKRTDGVILHHQGTGKAVPIDKHQAEVVSKWHVTENGWWFPHGYHGIVELDGTFKPGRPLWAKGAHAGSDNNDRYLGLMLAGDFLHQEPTPEQLNTTVWIITVWQRMYYFPSSNILGHKDVSDTLCPGNLDIELIRKRVEAAQREAELIRLLRTVCAGR